MVHGGGRLAPAAGFGSKHARIAAEILWRALIAVGGLHAYWLLGGTWAVHAGSGGAYHDVTPGLRVMSAAMVLLLVAAVLVVRARAGLGRLPVSDRIVRAAMWVLTVMLVLAALVNGTAQTNVERFAIAPFVLVLALLALVVAREGHGRVRSGEPQRAQPSH